MKVTLFSCVSGCGFDDSMPSSASRFIPECINHPSLCLGALICVVLARNDGTVRVKKEGHELNVRNTIAILQSAQQCSRRTIDHRNLFVTVDG